jgi:hypothetical protein
MAGLRERMGRLRRDHPLFFYGMTAVIAGIFVATVAVGSRVGLYWRDAASLETRLTEVERATRDSVLEYRSQRAQLAVGLLRREMRLRSLKEDQVHLAIVLDDSLLELRHGNAALRQARISVGPDSVIRSPEGETWRFIRPLGERHIAAKQRSPAFTIPEWHYAARGEPVPPESERRVEAGLGQWVIRLDDGTHIYSHPARGPFTDAVLPASFAVPEEELRAIFEAVPIDTPVYIY